MADFWAFEEESDKSHQDFVFPHITLRSFCDILNYQGYRAVSLPSDMEHVVLWYENCNNGPLCPYDIDQKSILRIRDKNSALEFLQNTEQGLVMIAVDDTDILPELEEYKERVIQMIPPEGTKLEVRTNLQRIFLDLLIWENRLNYAVSNEDDMQELLDIGASLLSHYMFICQVNGNVAFTTSQITPPNSDCEMIQNNHVVPQELKTAISKTLNTTKLDSETRTIDIGDGFIYFAIPFVFKNSLYGHLCACIKKGESFQGFLDAFERFGIYAKQLCYKSWTKTTEIRAPYVSVFLALLQGVKYQPEVLNSMLREWDVPKGSDFKLIAVDLKGASNCGIENITNALSLMHEGHTFILSYDKYLLALSFGSILGAKLSHKRTIDDFNKYIYQPYKLVGSSSQVFSNISNIDMAFKQLEFIDMYRDAVTVEASTIGEQPPSVMYFEMIFSYMTASQVDLDRAFLNFCHSHSVPDSIAQEDLINGSNKFALVWFFLVYERNASIVAKRMFMHRNTVLYHIKQIERHYDIDLSNHFIREKMKADFRSFFLHISPELYDKLFSIETKRIDKSSISE